MIKFTCWKEGKAPISGLTTTGVHRTWSGSGLTNKMRKKMIREAINHISGMSICGDFELECSSK